jgi:hypothetical protein
VSLADGYFEFLIRISTTPKQEQIVPRIAFIQPVIDTWPSIVTVHGIRDDYRTAWTDTEGDWWVKEQLFRDMSVREVDYSYEIDASSMIYEQNGIVRHAQNLIDEYLAVRLGLDSVGASCLALHTLGAPPSTEATG